jgi:uncharacterized membrane protein YgdD (TMEM256/DUF423 family)
MKTRPLDLSFGEVDAAQVCAMAVRIPQVSLAKVDRSQVQPSQVGSREVYTTGFRNGSPNRLGVAVPNCDGKRSLLEGRHALLIGRGAFHYNRTMNRTLLLIGAVAAFIGVGFGAFGAHGLSGRIAPEMLTVFETGVRYQMYHALAILMTALALGFADNRWLRAAGWLFTIGILLFSGSLYVLALTNIATLGMVTPLGGLAFLAGWACLIIAALM